MPGGTGSVEGGVIPYKPEALKIRNENREKWLERDPEIKCYLPGIPRATYMPYPFQIFQNRSAFVIAYEYAGAVRNIYLKDPGPPASDTWMGQSGGRWEGETFVVETTGFNGLAWLDRSGNFTSPNLKVTERFAARYHGSVGSANIVRTLPSGRVALTNMPPCDPSLSGRKVTVIWSPGCSVLFVQPRRPR